MNIKKNNTRCMVRSRTFQILPTSAMLLTLALISFSFTVLAQKNDVYVDKNGVMRWAKNREEVRAFGINYTAMFAHAYRTAKKMDIPLEQAIDNDVYHFSRLGFDFFRVHVW